MSKWVRPFGLATMLVLVWGSSIGLTQHPTTLKLIVQAGFAPAFLKLQPQLESRLNLKLQISERNAPQIFSMLTSPNRAQTDVVIVNNNGTLNRFEDQQWILKGSITPIVSTQIVLWCSSDRVNLRVSIGETLKAMQHVTLALPPTQAPSTRAIQPYLATLAKSVRVIYTDNTLDSWRTAYHQKADCAVTLKSLVAGESLTHYRAFPNHIAHISAAIPNASPHSADATRLIELLNSPLMRSKIQALGYQ